MNENKQNKQSKKPIFPNESLNRLKQFKQSFLKEFQINQEKFNQLSQKRHREIKLNKKMLQEKKQDNFRISDPKKIEKEQRATSITIEQPFKQIQKTKSLSDNNNQISSSKGNLPSQPSSSSSISTTNSSDCTPYLIEGEQDRDEEQKQHERRLNEFLPRKIGGMQIKRVQWSDFPGKPESGMCYWAHIYWYIRYNFTVEQRQRIGSQKSHDYIITHVNVNVTISKNSWVTKQTNYLLSHEQGHYLIGCLCALDFKLQLLKKKFTLNYNNQISTIFNSTLNYYSNMEIRYDQETNHSKNFQKQTQWFIFLYEQLNQFQEKLSLPPRPSKLFNSFNDNNTNNNNKENIGVNQQNVGNKKQFLPPIQKSTSVSLSRNSSNNNNNEQSCKLLLEKQQSHERRRSLQTQCKSKE